MIVKRDFKMQEEKIAIMVEFADKGYMLVEEQYHFDGNHLLFEISMVAEIDELTAELALLKGK